jgi:hypothetical protein
MVVPGARREEILINKRRNSKALQKRQKMKKMGTPSIFTFFFALVRFVGQKREANITFL